MTTPDHPLFDRDQPRFDRALGTLMGLAVGDALGTTLEFTRRDSTPPVTDMVGGGPFQLAPGEWTDDTSMALCLADALIAGDGAIRDEDLAARFLRWWKAGENSVNGRCFDIGISTRRALARFAETGRAEGNTDPHSAGNGGIMRLAPVVLAARGSEAQAVELARQQSAATHAAPECLDAAEALARILQAGIDGQGKDALDASANREFCGTIRSIAGGSWKAKSRDEIRSSGYVADTLEAALWAVHGADDFASAVLRAVNLGDDADTVGAVTGQVAGAIWGYSSIPLLWRTKLAWHDHIVGLGEGLWFGGRRP